MKAVCSFFWPTRYNTERKQQLMQCNLTRLASYRRPRLTTRALSIVSSCSRKINYINKSWKEVTSSQWRTQADCPRCVVQQPQRLGLQAMKDVLLAPRERMTMQTAADIASASMPASFLNSPVFESSRFASDVVLCLLSGKNSHGTSLCDRPIAWPNCSLTSFRADGLNWMCPIQVHWTEKMQESKGDLMVGVRETLISFLKEYKRLKGKGTVSRQWRTPWHS